MSTFDITASDIQKKIELSQLIVVENILHLLLCERKCITDLKLDILPGLVDMKKKQYFLLKKLFNSSDQDNFTGTIQRIRITDIEVKNSDYLSDGKLSLKTGLQLIKSMNAANARLYKSTLGFIIKCRKLLINKSNKDVTYTKKGSYSKVSGYLRINRKA